MRLTIELSPDVEAGLLAQAQARGLDIPHYVENVLRREAMAQTEASATSALPMNCRQKNGFAH